MGINGRDMFAASKLQCRDLFKVRYDLDLTETGSPVDTMIYTGFRSLQHYKLEYGYMASTRTVFLTRYVPC